MLDSLLTRIEHMPWEKFVPFGATLLTFFGAAVISFGWQYYANRKRFSFVDFIRHCFPFEGWTSKSSRIDVFMYFAGKLIGGVLVLGDLVIFLFLASMVTAGLHWLFPGHAHLHAGFATIVVWSIVFFLFADFSNFITHYWQHKSEILWELHKVHHSATFLSPLTTARMHPLGDKLDHLGTAVIVSLPVGVAVFLYGFTPLQLTPMLVSSNLIGTILVLDALRHSQFAVSFGIFDRILMSPHMHQLHHSARYEHWDHNMGNKLSIWDWMFGTGMIPSKKEPLRYGIGRGAEYDSQYDTLYGVYVRPIVGMVQVATGKAPKVLPTPQSLLEAGLTEPQARPKQRRGVKSKRKIYSVS